MSTAEFQDALAVFDLGTTSATLAEIATRRPDLWPAITGHPNAYPALVTWIERNAAAARDGTVRFDASPPPPPRRLRSVPSAPVGERADPPVRAKRPKRDRSSAGRGGTAALTIIVIALLAAIAFLAQQVLAAHETIDEQQRIIDEKQVFGAEMHELMSQAAQFDGIPMASLVPIDVFEALARQAWSDRNHAEAWTAHTTVAREYVADLRAKSEAMHAQRAENSSGTTAEAIIDDLGAGLVSTVFDDASATCQQDAAGCVISTDPTTIHLDAEAYFSGPNDEWTHSMLAYHEFAHVLQFTNPVPTESALAAFGNDHEFMADCYALTMTDSWSLEHRIEIADNWYWSVSTGYGRVCDAAQRDVIRSWLGEVGFRYRPISQ